MIIDRTDAQYLFYIAGHTSDYISNQTASLSIFFFYIFLGVFLEF
jgi:hypothetical protein